MKEQSIKKQRLREVVVFLHLLHLLWLMQQVQKAHYICRATK